MRLQGSALQYDNNKKLLDGVIFIRNTEINTNIYIYICSSHISNLFIFAVVAVILYAMKP